MSEPDDWSLVANAQNGDPAAFAVLVRRYQQPLVAFCYRMTRSFEDSQDLAQESFVRLHRHLQRLEPGARFSTVLFGIARNLTLNHLRDTARRGRGKTRPLDAAPEPEDGAASPGQAARQQEIGQWIEEALEALRPEHREIILLREMQGLDYEAIAEVLGCPKGTVRSRLARAREQLRQALLEMGGEAL